MKNIIIILILFMGSVTIFCEPETSDLDQNDDVQNDQIKVQRVFEDVENEYYLAKIFFNSEQKRYYKKLDEDGKRLFLDAFWVANDPNPATEENEFIEILKERISYSNSYYSHFKKGWKTDMGRILIRHGVPYEIIKDRSDILAKHGDKEYQIWKYRINKDLTFIFFDLQTHGDFRLIYSENDDRESSYPDWLEYLGSNFDEGILY